MRAGVLALLRAGWYAGSRIALGFGVLLAAAVGWFYASLPPASDLLDGRDRGSVTLLDRHGEVFAWRGDQFGGALRASDLSPHLVHAVIATEDKRYHDHWGVDPLGLARAMAATWIARETPSTGASQAGAGAGAAVTSCSLSRP